MEWFKIMQNIDKHRELGIILADVLGVLGLKIIATYMKQCSNNTVSDFMVEFPLLVIHINTSNT